MRDLTTKEARRMSAARKTYGHAPTITMRCGECGQALTMRQWRVHPTQCPNRPAPGVAPGKRK